MEFLALHIYHLDNDSEADWVMQLLEQKRLHENWQIERPTDNTNAIFIPIYIDGERLAEDWQVCQTKLNKSLELLSALDRETINSIKDHGLHIAMRIHTQEHYLPLPSDFVSACGNLGLEICILNKSAYR